MLVQVDATWYDLTGQKPDDTLGHSILSYVGDDLRGWMIESMGMMVTGASLSRTHTGHLASGRRVRVYLSLPAERSEIPVQFTGIFSLLKPLHRARKRSLLTVLRRRQRSSTLVTQLREQIDQLRAANEANASVRVFEDPALSTQPEVSRTAALDALSTERQRIQTLGIVYADGDRKIVWSNHVLEALVHRSLSELKGKPLESVFEGITGNKNALAHVNRQLNRRAGFRIELSDSSPDETERTIRIDCQPVVDNDDTFRGIIGIFDDRSVQNESEIALRISEERFRRLSDTSRDIVYQYRLFPTSGFEYLSPSIREATGFSVQDFLDNAEFAETLLGSGELERLSLETEPADAPKPYSVSFTTRDGRKIWLEHKVVPRFSQAGGLETVTGSARDITSFMETIESLREKDDRYSAFYENNVSIILLVDPSTGKIVDANPAACRYYGYERSELCGKAVSEINTLSETQIRAEMERALAQNKRHFVFKHRLASGELRDVEIFSGPVQISGRQYLYTLVHDITDLSKVVETSRHNESLFRAVFQSAGIGMILTHPSGKIVEANRTFVALTGKQLVNVLGSNLDQFVDPEDRTCDSVQSIQLASGQIDRYECRKRIITEDGATIPTHVTFSALRNDSGQILYLIGQIKDVTEQVASEVQLRTAADRYRMLSELLQTFGVQYRISSSQNVTFDWVTDSVESVLGYSAGAFRNQPVSALLHADDLDAFLEYHRSITIDQVVDAEFRLVHKNGQSRWIRLYGACSVDMESEERSFQGIGQDITQQKKVTSELTKAIEKAEEMSLLKDTFLTNISHEIRTPLTSILGYSEILADDLSGSQLEFIELIRGSGRRLLNTLSSILELAQLEGKSMDLFPSMFDLTSEVRSILSPYYAQARSSGLDLYFFGPESKVVPVYHDKSAIQHLLQHLLDNAIKFTPSGNITVTMKALKENVTFTVKDTGVGISPEFLPHVYEAFKQESRGFSRDYEGCGLGLTLARYLVELLKGTIQVESTRGVGTEITIVIPQRMKTGVMSVVTRDGNTYPIKTTVPTQAN